MAACMICRWLGAWRLMSVLPRCVRLQCQACTVPAEQVDGKVPGAGTLLCAGLHAKYLCHAASLSGLPVFNLVLVQLCTVSEAGFIMSLGRHACCPGGFCCCAVEGCGCGRASLCEVLCVIAKRSRTRLKFFSGTSSWLLRSCKCLSWLSSRSNRASLPGARSAPVGASCAHQLASCLSLKATQLEVSGLHLLELLPSEPFWQSALPQKLSHSPAHTDRCMNIQTDRCRNKAKSCRIALSALSQPT